MRAVAPVYVCVCACDSQCDSDRFYLSSKRVDVTRVRYRAFFVSVCVHVFIYLFCQFCTFCFSLSELVDSEWVVGRGVNGTPLLLLFCDGVYVCVLCVLCLLSSHLF